MAYDELFAGNEQVDPDPECPSVVRVGDIDNHLAVENQRKIALQSRHQLINSLPDCGRVVEVAKSYPDWKVHAHHRVWRLPRRI